MSKPRPDPSRLTCTDARLVIEFSEGLRLLLEDDTAVPLAADQLDSTPSRDALFVFTNKRRNRIIASPRGENPVVSGHEAIPILGTVEEFHRKARAVSCGHEGGGAAFCLWCGRERAVQHLDADDGAELEDASKEGGEAMAAEIHKRFTCRMHDLGQFMKGLLQRFSQWFNGQHQRTGTLWEQRFMSVIVESGVAARTIAAYVDLNPVRAGMVSDPADYRWSGYGEAVGGRGSRKGDGMVRGGCGGVARRRQGRFGALGICGWGCEETPTTKKKGVHL